MKEFHVYIKGWAGWIFSEDFSSFEQAKDHASILFMTGGVYSLGAKPKDRVEIRRACGGPILLRLPTF